MSQAGLLEHAVPGNGVRKSMVSSGNRRIFSVAGLKRMCENESGDEVEIS